MEIHFSDRAGMKDTMFVEPNSIIKDVLKEFLKRNNYYGDCSTELYIFRHGIRILNSRKFIDRRINDLLRPGVTIYFFNKIGLEYSCGEHICPYGCGRLIPNNYKGCTELLQAKPNYFS